MTFRSYNPFIADSMGGLYGDNLGISITLPPMSTEAMTQLFNKVAERKECFFTPEGKQLDCIPSESCRKFFIEAIRPYAASDQMALIESASKVKMCPEKFPWGWILGGTAALAVVGMIVWQAKKS